MTKPNPELLKKVRDRARHSLSHEVAMHAGLQQEALQQFVAGTFTPSPEQLHRLALRLGVPER